MFDFEVELIFWVKGGEMALIKGVYLKILGYQSCKSDNIKKFFKVFTCLCSHGYFLEKNN